MYNDRAHRHFRFVFCLVALCHLTAGAGAKAEDGYRLWLRYDPLPAEVANAYRTHITCVVVQGRSATLDAARTELVTGFSGLLGKPVASGDDASRDGSVIVGTPQGSPFIAGLGWGGELNELGPEGFVVRTVKLGRGSVTVIASESETGAFYGAFHILRPVTDAPAD